MLSSWGKASCKTAYQKEQCSNTVPNAEPRSCCISDAISWHCRPSRVQERGSITCRHACTHRLSWSFKSRKEPKRKQEKMVGKGDRKQERRRNQCKDGLSWFFLHNVVDYQVHSSEVLEMLDTNDVKSARDERSSSNTWHLVQHGTC